MGSQGFEPRSEGLLPIAKQNNAVLPFSWETDCCQWLVLYCKSSRVLRRSALQYEYNTIVWSLLCCHYTMTPSMVSIFLNLKLKNIYILARTKIDIDILNRRGDDMKGEVEITVNTSKGGVSITDHKAKESFRKAAMCDMLASVEQRDEEARKNDRDCFKRPL